VEFEKMIPPDKLQALETAMLAYYNAKRAHDDAEEEYFKDDGHTWDYFGRHHIDAMEKAGDAWKAIMLDLLRAAATVPPKDHVKFFADAIRAACGACGGTGVGGVTNGPGGEPEPYECEYCGRPMQACQAAAQAARERGGEKCSECGKYPPDHKGVCEGCLEYRNHQR
jgi:hypothetical protein